MNARQKLKKTNICVKLVREIAAEGDRIFSMDRARELARRLEISSPGVGFSVERGKAIARENRYHLIE